MKILTKTTSLLFLVAAVLISAFNPSVNASLAESNSSLIWIDSPLDGSRLPIAPYEVVMHATGGQSQNSFDIRINGKLEKTITAVSTQGNGNLLIGRYWWLPPTKGEYLIEISPNGVSGSNSASSQAKVLVGDEYRLIVHEPFDPQSEVGDDPDVQTVEPTPTLTATVGQIVESTPTLTATATPCFYNAEWVNQGQPEVYTMYAFSPFTVNWQLKNTGTCPWEATFKLVHIDSGDTPAGFVQNELPIGTKVEPGGILDYKMALTSPESGYGRVHWMLNNGLVNFAIGPDSNTAFWFDYEVQGKAGDNEPPIFTVMSLSPQYPSTDDVVTAYVEAKDNVGIVQIRMIFSQGSNVQEASCFNKDACIVSFGGWSAGPLIFDAFAIDSIGNEGRLGGRSIQIQEKAVPAPQIPITNPTPVPPTRVPPTKIPIPAKDTTPPTISYNFSPKNPSQENKLTVSVSAKDNTQVASISIVLTPQEGGTAQKQVCKKVSTCSLSGYFIPGDLLVNLSATDAAGNTASVFPFVIKVSAVIK